MALSAFLDQLFHGEPLVVGAAWDPPALGGEGASEAVGAVLRRFHEEDMLELAGAPLPLDEGAARWAAVRLYLAAQAFRLRDVEETTLRKVFAGGPGGRLSAARAHAVDLSFRFLPGVLALARGLAPGDALIALGRKLLAPWPLSSVGVSGIAVPRRREGVLLSQPGLRLRYLDRILAARDYGRLTHPDLAAAAEGALGCHRSLAPGWDPAASTETPPTRSIPFSHD
jgi:hypothetical protein